MGRYRIDHENFEDVKENDYVLLNKHAVDGTSVALPSDADYIEGVVETVHRYDDDDSVQSLLVNSDGIRISVREQGFEGVVDG